MCDEPALVRRERPVNDCEIEEYQIWKRVGFDAMTFRRTGRRTRICYLESGPKLVGNEAPGLWAVGAMPDEVHNGSYCCISTKSLRLPWGSSALKRCFGQILTIDNVWSDMHLLLVTLEQQPTRVRSIKGLSTPGCTLKLIRFPLAPRT